MKSIRLKILIWCFTAVVFSVAALILLTFWQANSNDGPLRAMIDAATLQAEQAATIDARGDRKELVEFIGRAQRRLGKTHRFVTAQGIDLATGEDRSLELNAARNITGPARVGQEMVMAVRAPQGHVYLLIVRKLPPLDPLAQLPYFLLILASMGLFCWLLAVNIAAPLGRMAAGVRRFGAGELDTRLSVPRKDEIGQLGQAFDEMAGRIQSLVQAERQLLQDISHELRAPLARLGVAAQLATRPEERTAALLQVEREVERLGELVGDLVAMTKAEHRTPADVRRRVRLETLTQDVIDTCQVEAAARHSSITLTNRADGGIALLANTELLWRLLENVLRNAIHHAPSHSVVEVAISRVEAAVAEVTIRDHGPGVPHEELPKLFRPFYRTDPSRTSDTGGLGLGLSIAQRAALLHHGSIEAENASPGLRVRIHLPLSLENS
jgi:two-component system sensor histidine kinase CpxA